jgi:hypothetical protein
MWFAFKHFIIEFFVFKKSIFGFAVFSLFILIGYIGDVYSLATAWLEGSDIEGLITHIVRLPTSLSVQVWAILFLALICSYLFYIGTLLQLRAIDSQLHSRMEKKFSEANWENGLKFAELDDPSHILVTRSCLLPDNQNLRNISEDDIVVKRNLKRAIAVHLKVISKKSSLRVDGLSAVAGEGGRISLIGKLNHNGVELNVVHLGKGDVVDIRFYFPETREYGFDGVPICELYQT